MKDASHHFQNKRLSGFSRSNSALPHVCKPDNMMLMAMVMMTPGFYIIMHFGLICYDPEEDYYYYISIVAPVLSVHYQAGQV